MTTPIPPPHEPLSNDKDTGRANDVWYRYWEDASRAINSASSSLSAISISTYGATIVASTTASVARTALGLGSASTGASTQFTINKSDPVATTGTTAVSITTGIPANVSRITVLFDGVSVNTTAPFLVRLGTTSGIVASGYNAACVVHSAAGFNGNAADAGFSVFANTSNRHVHGSYVISRITSHTWVGSLAAAASEASIIGGGSIPLGAELDRVSLATSAAHVFDAGTASVHWEF